MTSTEDGYLYVSDWVGNKVVKYDFNGKYIMTVGLPNEQFKGLRQPTGIAATAQELFIVDSKDRLIHVFDHSGNYLRTFGQGLLERPEQIRIEHNRLLIADGKRVISYDLSTGMSSLPPISMVGHNVLSVLISIATEPLWLPIKLTIISPF